MIELAFDESPAGALKMAKSMKKGDRMQGATAVIGGTAKERAKLLREARKPRVWQGETMDGSSRDVAMLKLDLDIGDISDADGSKEKRKAVLDELFGQYPGVSDAIWNTNLQGFARLEDAKASLEPIRMWVCAASPAELCGLHLVCRLMEGAETPLSVVRVPQRVEKDNCVIEYRSTGDIDAEVLGAIATAYTQPLSAIQRMPYTSRWCDLARENAPLRASVSGRLMGVAEDFYDFALRANIPEGECMVARIIGRALGDVPGVHDLWLFRRIRAMLQSGELIEVSPATGDHPYSAVVRRRE